MSLLRLALSLTPLFAGTLRADDAPALWSQRQAVSVPQAGLVRVKLPRETLSQAQPTLADLRLSGPDAEETPYFVERPVPEDARWVALGTFGYVVDRGRGVATARLEGGPELEALRLETPASEFLNGATLEVSAEGRAAQTVFRNRAVFRQADGVESLELPFPPGRWSKVSLTLESNPPATVPVTGLSARERPRPVAGLEEYAPVIREVASDARQTLLKLDLGAANLLLTSLSVQASDPLFTRRVELFYRVYNDNAVQERLVGAGSISRVSVSGGPAGESLSVPLRGQVPSREAFLRILNGDSPPLHVAGIRLQVAPAYLVFLAQKPGSYALLAGNPAAQARDYDVASLRETLNKAKVADATFGVLGPNPGYTGPQPLAGVEETGTPLDVADWPYRKPVELKQGGVQRLELDPQSLSREPSSFADLRLLREGRQIPYILDYTGVQRSLEPKLEPASASGHVSRWVLTLPYARLPLSQIQCSADQALFRRVVTLSSEAKDERGDTITSPLGSAQWTRLWGQPPHDLIISLGAMPQAQRLTLSVDNGDNPPLRLSSCRAYYRSPRLLFKASAGAGLELYYGRASVSAPVYDLQLASAELLSAIPHDAALGGEESLKVSPWWEPVAPTGAGRYFFWGVLALVVVALLAVVAKLLPEESPTAGG